MVKRLLSSLKRESSSIHDAAYVLAFFAFLSQILGLFRDRMLAHYFGAGEMLDMYYAAFRVPDLIFVTVASLVSSSVLIPFIQDKVEKGKEEAKKFIDEVWSAFFGLITIVSILALILMPWFTDLLFPSFDLAMKKGVVDLSRILLLSPILLGLSNFLSSIVQAERRFALFALSPVLYNFAIILGLIILFPTFGLKGVVIGVVFGSFLHAMVQIPFAKSLGMLPDIIFPIRIAHIKKIALISLPRTLAIASISFALAIIVSFASDMAAGSIAVLMLAYNLQGSPMTIIGVSYSTAAFPTLTKLISNGEKDKFLKYVANSLRHIILLTFVATALFIVLRAQIVRTVLGTGAFSWNDTRLTAAVFAIFAISAFAQSANLLFVRAYYALGKTKLPLMVSIGSSAISVIFAFLFSKLFYYSESFREFLRIAFRLDGVSGLEVLSLPIGFSIGTIIGTVAFVILFEKSFKGTFSLIRRAIYESLLGACIAGGASYIGLYALGSFFTATTLLAIFSHGLVAGIFGILSAYIILRLIDNKETLEIEKNIKKRFMKQVPLPVDMVPFDSI